ncbi:MAG: hypothetical protein EB015_16795, partial [Methylocystaceae bacterium]|nr:hypothetical protein [Methylocystaceae bacterium]
MKHSVAYRALAIAAFGAFAFNTITPAKAGTDDDIAFLKARLKQLEAQVAKQAPARSRVDARGTGQGLIGTGTSGSGREPQPSPASAGPGTTGRYEGGSAPDPQASLQHWYDRISIRGYTQMRYTNFLQNSESYNDGVYWADNSARPRSNFLIRRMRLIFSGDVSEHLYVYIQPDFASTPPGGFSNSATFIDPVTTSTSGYTINRAQNAGAWAFYNPGVAFVPYGAQIGTYGSATGGNFAQLRDAYADIYFDKDKEFRVRAGQSKIPYGFTNMQSSQNRLTLDRPDALNTATRDERDLGLYFYYTPKEMRHLFRDLVKNNLKGSGDYGMFAFGVYNGQGANRVELNSNTHLVSRFTYPYVFENGQVVEASIQGYTGRVMPITAGIRPSFGMATNWAGAMPTSAIAGINSGYVPYVNGPGYSNMGDYKLFNYPANTGGAPSTSQGWAPACANGCQGIQDSRVALTGVIYPQPFGVQAEWNWGVSPGLNGSQTAITKQNINGGYVLVNYKYEDKDFGLGTFFPYVQYQYFNGYSKYETNAPQNRVNEWDIGLEYQPLPEIELTASYNKSDRTNITAAPYRQFQADTLRWQLQW